MPNLLQEAREESSEKVAVNVRNLGGNLFDEAGIKSGDTSRLSARFTEQQADDERKRLFDELNASLSGFEQFAVGAGRGLTTIARGAGLVEQEDPATQQAFGQLADESNLAVGGEILGEALPLLAVPTPGAKASFAKKVLAAGGIGAAEGGLIARGKQGDAADTLEGASIGSIIGSGVEALSPAISSLGRAILRGLGRRVDGPLLTPDGQPTPELQQGLQDSGTTFEELTQDAFAITNQPGVDPAQAARSARFESQQIPATTGDITQEFTQQAAEQRLLSQASSEAGEPLRQVKLQQSEAFTARVDELVEGLGVPANVGASLKEALEGRKTLLKKEKNALYKQVFDTAPEVAAIPLLTDNILEAVPGGPELRRLSRLAGSQVSAVQELLVEFGVDKSPEAVKAFTESGGEISPLSLGNFEDFRQALNLFERADQTGAASVVIGPVKQALDAEAELVDTHVKNAGFTDEGVLDTLKQARSRVRTIKTEFSPESITGRLIGVKRDGVTPVIEASKAADTLLQPNAPIENLQRTLTSLRDAGEPGQKAIRDLQASVVLNALEQSLKAPSRKTGGVQTVGGNQFANALSKFGDDKLAELFRGSEQALDRLQNLKQTALDITPTSGAVPKGSAAVILDVVGRASSLPGLAAVRDTVKFIVNAGADDRAVRRAIEAKPVFARTVSAIERDFPSLAAALGIATVVPLGDDE